MSILCVLYTYICIVCYLFCNFYLDWGCRPMLLNLFRFLPLSLCLFLCLSVSVCLSVSLCPSPSLSLTHTQKQKTKTREHARTHCPIEDHWPTQHHFTPHNVYLELSGCGSVSSPRRTFTFRVSVGFTDSHTVGMLPCPRRNLEEHKKDNRVTKRK